MPSGASAAADGTKYDLAENSLLAEYSIRYGGYGGIAYHHVADTYVALFSHFIPCGVTIDWGLIETHWQDLMQVVLSIKAGAVSSALLPRKLGTYSRKSRLYQAFRELGRVVRTEFLLRFLADSELRQQIMAGTNKVEAYHGFAKWLHFGWDGLIQETDPEEQEKRIKYNDLVANAVAIQNVIDLTRAVSELIREGYPVKREDLAALSPYQTRHIKRFGDYLLPDGTPEPFDGELVMPLTTTPD